MTKDLQYMCDAMGVPLPFLPFEGKAEDQLFAKLILEHKGRFDDVKFSLEWCKHVDPTILEEETASNAQEDDSPTSTPPPPSATTAPSRKRKSPAAALSHTWRVPTHPRYFPIPLPQAMHNAPYVQHGGMVIGNIPLPQQGHGNNKFERNKVCTLCLRNQGTNAETCPGRGSHKRCRYFERNGTPKPLQIIPTKRKLKCGVCGCLGCPGVGGRKHCKNK
mmetsp:Transcript_22767/g.37520  ORF Transcript_22767/g.37520 Transcript_22767/m.37520 type:complete len:219 (+) Transcript_22767:537-1193(+)